MPEESNLLRLIDRLNDTVGRASSLLIPLIGGLLTFEVIMRYAFNRPTLWTHDLSQFLFGASFMLAAGYTLLNRGHVNMNILYSRLPARGKAIMDVGTGVFFLIFCFVLVWKSGFMAWESVKYKEVFTQSVWEPPLYPIKIVFFLGCLLLMLQGVAKFARDLILVSKHGKGIGNG